MISVIMPTMWKAPHWSIILPQLDAHPLIGEIIVIDNNTANTNPDIHKLNKLVYLPQESNIFVNPAWNLGVSLAKYENLCIMNDDCLINADSLQQIHEQLNISSGIFGFSEDSYCDVPNNDLDLINSSFEAVKMQSLSDQVSFKKINPLLYRDFSGMPHPAYGSFMFMNRQSYYEIPTEFKIHYGDLFLYLMNLKNGKHNFTIEDAVVITTMSSTVGTNQFGYIETPITLSDKEHFVDVLTRYEIYNLDVGTLYN